MPKILCYIYDVRLKEYAGYFVANSEIDAKRKVGFEVRRENSILNLKPKDFELGMFCQLPEEGKTGKVPEIVVKPKTIANIKEIFDEYTKN